MGDRRVSENEMNVAGFEDGEGTMTERMQRTLEAGKDRETDFPLEPLEGKSALSKP